MTTVPVSEVKSTHDRSSRTAAHSHIKGLGLSSDGRATLSVWGENNVFNRSLKEQMTLAKRDWGKDKGRITYWKMGSGYYVLSGLTGQEIFYEKTVPIRGGFATILWQFLKFVYQCPAWAMGFMPAQRPADHLPRTGHETAVHVCRKAGLERARQEALTWMRGDAIKGLNQDSSWEDILRAVQSHMPTIYNR